MSRNLVYTKANFCGISKSITRLETVGIQLCDAINIVKRTESELPRVQGEVSNKVKAKLQSVLERNPGYSTLCKFPDILRGNEAELGGNGQELSANDLTLFKYSPVMSCDVERSFSSYSIRFYLVTIRGPSSLTILKCMSSSTATLPKTKAKLRCEFFIIIKSKYISPFIMQKVNSVYLQSLYCVNNMMWSPLQCKRCRFTI